MTPRRQIKPAAEPAEPLKTSPTTLYQFKIVIQDVRPQIWRRIQVKNCTLRRLHEYIQTVMGWANAHLHQFMIEGVLYGDLELVLEGFWNEPKVVNSLETRISEILPEDGSRFRFEYEYDIGDGWEHEILFEGCLKAEKGKRYPLCLEGERACPLEDVGGPASYQVYLETLGHTDQEQWAEFSKWRGLWRPDQFNADAATKRMRRGLPN